MRKSSTDAEAKLWSILRSRQLAGYKFRRQHRVAGYILDFYCLKHRLAIELDGGQHADADAIQYDQQRTRHLAEVGVQVMRYSDIDMLKDSETISADILSKLEEDPHPDPLPAYRERG
jgi:very-short-patch-repair endonuclease